MKKLLCIFLAAAALLSLTACGPSGQPADREPAPTVSPAVTEPPAAQSESTEGSQSAPGEEADGLAFVYNGTTIQPNALAEPILSALGEPKSYTEETSCAFDGLDKTYFYGSFYLQTYPAADGDRVFCLWLVDDTVTTPEGVYIGSTEQQVKDAYGEDCLNGSSCIVTQGDCKLTIVLTDGAVSSIVYDVVLA